MAIEFIAINIYTTPKDSGKLTEEQQKDCKARGLGALLQDNVFWT